MMQMNRAPRESALGANQRDDRKEVIRADVSNRLRSVCSNFSDADFANLVDTIAERKLREERRIP
jgi:hypothetical protein